MLAILFAVLYWLTIYVCIGGMVAVVSWKLRSGKWEKLADIHVEECIKIQKKYGDKKEEKPNEPNLSDDIIKVKKEGERKRLLLFAKCTISITMCLTWPLTVIYLLTVPASDAE